MGATKKQTSLRLINEQEEKMAFNLVSSMNNTKKNIQDMTSAQQVKSTRKDSPDDISDLQARFMAN